MDKEQQVVAMGLTAEQWIEMLKGDKACNAKKALNYLDGMQEEEMVKLLSDPFKGRKNWKQRGIIPRSRNLTRMIVEKSAQLFMDAAPTFEVYLPDSETVQEEETKFINDELYKTEFQEFFINVDTVVRLLKTTIVLLQYNDIDKRVEFDLLHRGNCAVMVNPVNRAIDALIYITSCYEGVHTYRIITPDQYIDLMEVETAGRCDITVSAINDNPYGIVPATPFYDTTLPRSGFWVDAPNDLIGLNEIVNLHLTDSEYAISWAKLPTLFMIDCEAIDGGSTMEVVEQFGQALPRQAPTDQVHIGGPSRAISLQSNGQGVPSVQYLKPEVNIQPIDQVIDSWIKGFAGDWSVRIKTAGEGQATSGFQLVVEEMPNLELRKQRQRMFEAGFKRLYNIFKIVMQNATGKAFAADTKLEVEFADPTLPTDTKAEEEVWNLRIAGGRASRVDYLMETQGMTHDEAVAKLIEIDKYNAGLLEQPPAETEPKEPFSDTFDVDSNTD